MRGLITAAALVLMLLSGVTEADDFRTDMIDIDTAARRNDVTALEDFRAGLASSAPDYRHGYVDYSLSLAQQVDGRDDEAERTLADAVTLLKGLVEAHPKSAESWALLSACYGLQIGYSPFKGPFLGPRANGALKRALELAPDNPRVALIKGISLYQTPGMFGGDREGSIEWFTGAIDAFALAPGDDIGWGYADAYVWRALAHYHFEHAGLALADLDSALAVAPDHAWARHLKEEMTAPSRTASAAGE